MEGKIIMAKSKKSRKARKGQHRSSRPQAKKPQSGQVQKNVPHSTAKKGNSVERSTTQKVDSVKLGAVVKSNSLKHETVVKSDSVKHVTAATKSDNVTRGNGNVSNASASDAPKNVETEALPNRKQQVQELRAKYEKVVAENKAPVKTESAQPTFKDWQEKQKRLVEEAYEKKQEELKLQEVAMELEAVKPKKRNLTWILAGVAAILVLINAGVGLWALASSLLQPKEETVAAKVEGAKEETDYKQKILSETGEEFEPSYQMGEMKELTMVFPDLDCDSNNDTVAICQNIDKLKLDGIALFEEDYALSANPVTLQLKVELLEALTEGEHDLTFRIKQDGIEKTIGVKIAVKAIELSCEEGQIVEDGVCTEKEDEEVAQNQNPQTRRQDEAPGSAPTQSQPQKPTTPATRPSQPAEPTKSPEQMACEYSIGPKEVYVIHWESDNQVHVIKGHFTLNATGAAKMVWVNGSCRPAVSASGFVATVDNSMTADRARILYGERVPIASIIENPGQDTVTWRWKNNSLTTDFMGDARVVLGY